jgi:hypothetical protein
MDNIKENIKEVISLNIVTPLNNDSNLLRSVYDVIELLFINDKPFTQEDEYYKLFPLKKNIVKEIGFNNSIILDDSSALKELNNIDNSAMFDENTKWYKILYNNKLRIKDLNDYTKKYHNNIKINHAISPFLSGKIGIVSENHQNDYRQLCIELMPFLNEAIFLIYHPKYWPTILFNIFIMNFHKPNIGIKTIDIEEDKKFSTIETLTLLNDDNKLYEKLKQSRKKIIQVREDRNKVKEDWIEPLNIHMKNNRETKLGLNLDSFEEYLKNFPLYKEFMEKSIKKFYDEEIKNLKLYDNVTIDDTNDDIISKKIYVLQKKIHLILRPFYGGPLFKTDLEAILGQKYVDLIRKTISTITKNSNTAGEQAPITTKTAEEQALITTKTSSVPNILNPNNSYKREYKLKREDHIRINQFLSFIVLFARSGVDYNRLQFVWNNTKTDTPEFKLILDLKIFPPKESNPKEFLTLEQANVFKDYIIFIKKHVQNYNTEDLLKICDYCDKTNIEDYYPSLPDLIGRISIQTHQIILIDEILNLKYNTVDSILNSSVRFRMFNEKRKKAESKIDREYEYFIALMEELVSSENDRLDIIEFIFKERLQIFKKIFKLPTTTRKKLATTIDNKTIQELGNSLNKDSTEFHNKINNILIRNPKYRTTTDSKQLSDISPIYIPLVKETLEIAFTNHIFIQIKPDFIRLYCQGKNIDKSIYFKYLKEKLDNLNYAYRSIKIPNGFDELEVSKEPIDTNIINLNDNFSLLFIENIWTLDKKNATFFYISNPSWIHTIFNNWFHIVDYKIEFKLKSKDDVYSISLDKLQGIFCIKAANTEENKISDLLNFNMIHNYMSSVLSELNDINKNDFNNKLIESLDKYEDRKIITSYYNAFNAFFDNIIIKSIHLFEVQNFSIEWIRIINAYQNIRLISTLVTPNMFTQNASLKKKFHIPKKQLQLYGLETLRYKKIINNIKIESFNNNPFNNTFDLVKKRDIFIDYFSKDIMNNPRKKIFYFGNENINYEELENKSDENRINNNINITVNALRVDTTSDYDIFTKTHNAYFMYKLQIPWLKHYITKQQEYNKTHDDKQKYTFEITCKYDNETIFYFPLTSLSLLYKEQTSENIKYNTKKDPNIYILSTSLRSKYYGDKQITTKKKKKSTTTTTDVDNYGTIGHALLNDSSTHAESFFDIQNVYKIFDNEEVNTHCDINLESVGNHKKVNDKYHYIPHNLMFVPNKNQKGGEEIKKPKKGGITNNMIYFNNMTNPEINKNYIPGEFTNGVNTKILNDYNLLLKRFVNEIKDVYNVDDRNYYNKIVENDTKTYYKQYREMLERKKPGDAIKMYSPFQYMKRLLLEIYLLSKIDHITLVIIGKNPETQQTTTTYEYDIKDKDNSYDLIVTRPNKGTDPFYNIYPFYDIETNLVLEFMSNGYINKTNVSNNMLTRFNNNKSLNTMLYHELDSLKNTDFNDGYIKRLELFNINNSIDLENIPKDDYKNLSEQLSTLFKRYETYINIQIPFYKKFISASEKKIIEYINNIREMKKKYKNSKYEKILDKYVYKNLSDDEKKNQDIINHKINTIDKEEQERNIETAKQLKNKLKIAKDSDQKKNRELKEILDRYKQNPNSFKKYDHIEAELYLKKYISFSENLANRKKYLLDKLSYIEPDNPNTNPNKTDIDMI